MSQYHEILKKYWNFERFRPLQLEIIQSIAKGNDTLGLMPTGGGKSITFQIYSLSQPGICIVITPLISLMNDQVERLKSKDIKAMAIHSGLSKYEIKIALDNAVWGDYKFLYISPERLESKHFIERLTQMNVNLIAVDEAHCISQWGYDFRPSYLNIVELRKYCTDVTFLALTATATAKVIDDIQNKLQFEKSNVKSVSFERKNLKYLVRNIENKIQYILSTVKKSNSSGLVYVRSRKLTKEIADILNQNNISADYYHAGLSNCVRSRKQEQWSKGENRVMVATNAFGMGIDKSNVRFVIHYDAPNSLEAYFQEAGRAGRDGEKSAAVLLYNNSDKTKLKKRSSTTFPPKDYIKKVYEALCNYLQIAEGFGAGQIYNFNFQHFNQTFNLQKSMAHSSLKILEQDKYIEYSEDVNMPPRLIFIASRDELYRFQTKADQYDHFLRVLLRSYTGLFSQYVYIDKELLSKRAGITVQKTSDILKQLSKSKIINYIPGNDLPLIKFTKDRVKSDYFSISKKVYDKRKEDYMNRANSVIEYAENDSICRSKLLLNYFNEKDAKDCGICDICVSKQRDIIANHQFEKISSEIKNLTQEPIDAKILLNNFGNSENYKEVLSWLIDNKKIIYKDDQLIWNR